MTLEQVQEAEFQSIKHVTFISEEQINILHWLKAEELLMDIDPKDVHYVAYAKHFKCKLWSGDKKLIKGLAKKGFTNTITTDELHQFISTS